MTLTTEPALGTAERISVSWVGLPQRSSRGDVIYLADGRIRLRVKAVAGDEVTTEVEVGGTVSSRQGLNCPNSDIPLPAVGKADLDWIDFAVDQDVDLLAVSFVRRREHLEPVAQRLAERGVDTPVIAKIENRHAADNAEEILAAATGGIMVARGDLGIELPIEDVPARAEAAARALRTPLEAVDHRHADAGLDGAVVAADPRRGVRRRERDLRRHRRGDALGGDGDRRLSGRGGARSSPRSRRQPRRSFPTATS